MRFSSRRNILFYAFLALTMSLELALPTPARAEEIVPPTEMPVDASSVVTEEDNGETVSLDLTGTVALLDETSSVLTGADGEPLSLATQEATELLADPDPYIVRSGTTYQFTAADCDPVTAGLQPCTNPVQAAINFAVAGETINIDPGTYIEQLMINKNITLQGTGAGVVIQSPTSLANCFTTSAQNKAIVCVTGADNVSLMNLTVDGAGLGNANYRFQGIGYYNAGGTIDGNTVLNIEDTPFSGAQHGVSIYAIT